MTVHQINLSLRISAAVLATLAVLVLAAAIVRPLQHPPIAGTNIAQSATTQSNALPPLMSFAPLFRQSLQTPTASLPDGAANSQAAVDQAAATGTSTIQASQLRLVGTIGNSLALIKGPDGTIALIEPGDDINGAPVLAIRQSEVDLRLNGKLTTLHMMPPPNDAAVISSN